MNILILGSGGREHALAVKISQSRLSNKIYIWPGHPVLADNPRFIIIPQCDVDQLIQISAQKQIDLVVCGPEKYLDEGFADKFKAAKIPFFGPTQQLAQLEASKVFAKKVMSEAGIPTAKFEVAYGRQDCLTKAVKFLEETSGVVLKASGLASGKGVFVCKTMSEVDEAVRRLFESTLQHAAEKIVIEEILEGRECSFFVFMGKSGTYNLGFAVDHKRLRDGDEGPNTGGMGCYAPVPWLPKEAESQVTAKIVEPLLKYLKQNNMVYEGCLYVGLMCSNKTGMLDYNVVEFNARLGDPEAQVLSVSDSSDWLAHICRVLGLNILDQKNEKQKLKPALAYVLASRAYPYFEQKETLGEVSKKIFDQTDNDIRVFASALKTSPRDTESYQTQPGRVMTVVAAGETFEKAREKAFEKIAAIHTQWPDFQFRKDIGKSLESKS